MTAIVHCPECGAITRAEDTAIGETTLVCTDDDCPRIVVEILSRPITHREVAEALARKEQP